MELIEKHQDLFTVDSKYYFAQCISADFAMSAGIAVQFNRHFDIKNKILSQYSLQYLKDWVGKTDKTKGDCLLVDQVFNLVTKTYGFEKPTYKALAAALQQMRYYCLKYSIEHLAMPRIGCGIDGLEWQKVKQLIISTFEDTDIEILVCVLDDKQRVESICNRMDGSW